MELQNIDLQKYIRTQTLIDFEELIRAREHVITYLRTVHGVEVPSILKWSIRQAQDGSHGFNLVTDTFPHGKYPDARIHILAKSQPPNFSWWFYPEWSRMEGKMHEIFSGSF